MSMKLILPFVLSLVLVCGCDGTHPSIKQPSTVATITSNDSSKGTKEAKLPTKQESVTFRTKTIPLIITKTEWDKTILTEFANNAGKAPWWTTLTSATTGLPLSWNITSSAIKAYFESRDGKQVENNLELGSISFSESIVCGPPVRKSTNFESWHVSVPISIEPHWNTMQKIADENSHILFSLEVLSVSGEPTCSIQDILPNTLIVSQNFGGKVELGIGVNGKWGPVESRNGASFFWNWNPKVTVIASGAAGNKAFIILNQKPDKAGWLGKLPVELSILTPVGATELRLAIKPYIVFNSDKQVPLGQIDVRTLLER